MQLLSSIALITAVTLSTACGAETPTGPGTAEVRLVTVLGDSLAISPSRGESFPAVLQTYIDAADLNWTVVNDSRAGDTTADGLRRVDGALDRAPGVLVLALGANDGLRHVDVPRIEDHLAEIIRRARARGVEVLLCGMETPPFNGLDYSIAFHQVYPRLASAFDVPLVPFLLSGVALNRDLNGRDGVHPNAAGARRIADTVWPHLAPLLGHD